MNSASHELFMSLEHVDACYRTRRVLFTQLLWFLLFPLSVSLVEYTQICQEREVGGAGAQEGGAVC